MQYSVHYSRGGHATDNDGRKFPYNPRLLVPFCGIVEYLPQTYHLAPFNETLSHHIMS